MRNFLKIPVSWSNSWHQVDPLIPWAPHRYNNKICSCEVWPVSFLQKELFDLENQAADSYGVSTCDFRQCLTWFSASIIQIRRLNILQNRELRIIVRAPSFVSNAQVHKDLAFPVLRKHASALGRPPPLVATRQIFAEA